MVKIVSSQRWPRSLHAALQQTQLTQAPSPRGARPLQHTWALNSSGKNVMIWTANGKTYHWEM